MSRFLLPLALLLAVFHANPLSAQTKDAAPEEEKKINYRLPDNVIPENYNILLKPTLEDSFTFTGKSVIRLKVVNDTKQIILHSKGLKYPSEEAIIEISTNKPTSEQKTKLKYEEKKDFLIIDLPQLAEKGTIVTVTLKYTGKLNDDLRGFYRSSYINEKGEKRWLATTHFEPTGARLAFPCMDEPALKATFEISMDLTNLKNPKEYKVISNMPKEENDNEFVTTFQKTPPMSTYLVAFVVSDFVENENNYPMRVWTRKELKEDTNYALNIGTKILKAMEKYVGVLYSLPKMDQVGIPDFAAGAMENWGLVTYREKALVYNEKTSSVGQKQAVASIIAHEFAHQWFGNHVGPAWWKYLWLNEGFANFFQYFITDDPQVENFQMREQFVVQILQGAAFSFDATEKTHPMNVEVESPSEISKIFDAISYQKSGSVIRMMQHFLTDKVFKAGLKDYLDAKKNNAATSDDLFKALDKQWKQKNQSLEKIMNTWVTQSGYPVITVSRYYNNNTVQVVQERFFTKPQKEKSNQTWWIPLNYATEPKAEKEFKSTSAIQWFDSENKNFDIDVDPKHWIIFNKQQTGYYRVNYDRNNWDLIINYLKSENSTKINNLNRAQLLDDAWNLARAGHLEYEVAWDITQYLFEETDYFPWYSAIRSLSLLKNQLIHTPHYENFRKAALDMAMKLVKKVGFVENKEDDHITKLNRGLALRWVCGLGFKNCTTEFEKIFNPWLENAVKNPINPNLKSVVLCTILEKANQTIWDKVYDRYLTSQDSFEQTAILTSLGCSRNATILEHYLDLAIEKDTKINSTSTVFEAVYNGNEIGLNVTVKYIFTHVIGILKNDKGDDSNLLNYLEDIGKKISTEQQLNTLKAYFNMDLTLDRKVADSVIEHASDTIEWVKNNGDVIGLLIGPKTPDTNNGSPPRFASIFALIPIFFALFT